MKTKTITMIAIGSLLLLGMIVPVASAQTIPAGCNAVTSASMSRQSQTIGEETIQPITGLETLKVTFLYTTEAQGTSVTTIPITFDVSADQSWVTASALTTNAFIQVKPNEPTSEPVTVDVTIAVSQNAPAFEKATIRVTAQAAQGACVPPSNVAEASQIIQAGFYENWQGKFQSAIEQQGQNAKFQFNVELDNFGNGAIRTTFAVAEGTSSQLSIALPGPQIVESTIAGGDTSKQIVPIDVQTPFKNGYENRRDSLIIDIAGTAAFDTNIKLEPLQLSAVVQTQGVYVPGFEAISLLAAVLGMAFVARRRL